ncbi:MAG: ATP-binding protein, partial [Gammaproteobacteria bacterium]
EFDLRLDARRSDELGDLARHFNALAARLAGAEEARRQWVADTSHELRTPIARLEFALELLNARAADPALSKRIAAMEGDLAELNELVNELLSMSKLDNAQEPQRAPFELAPLLRDCADGLHPRPQHLCVDLDDGLGSVNGDRRLLGRAVGNLLRNAQKYAAHEVALRARRIGGRIEIGIEDDGPGIPEDERDRIFEPFYRLDRSRDRATGGFGLGLSIARKAIVLHGGTVYVEGSALGGARFVISLPDGVASASASTASEK